MATPRSKLYILAVEAELVWVEPLESGSGERKADERSYRKKLTRHRREIGVFAVRRVPVGVRKRRAGSMYGDKPSAKPTNIQTSLLRRLPLVVVELIRAFKCQGLSADRKVVVRLRGARMARGSFIWPGGGVTGVWPNPGNLQQNTEQAQTVNA